jgi:hypothetical protein
MNTKAEAQKLAEQTAQLLGSGWKPDIWENCGWHAKAVSNCRRWKVHVHVVSNGVRGYTAFLGEVDFPGGYWAESDDTPQGAFDKTLKAALADVLHKQELVLMAPYVNPTRKKR